MADGPTAGKTFISRIHLLFELYILNDTHQRETYIVRNDIMLPVLWAKSWRGLNMGSLKRFPSARPLGASLMPL